MPGWVTVVAEVIAAAGVSFFFALAESALFSLGVWRLQRLAEHAPRSGGTVERLLKSPQDLLATIVLGSTFTNAAAVALTWWAARVAGWSLGASIASLCGVFVLLVVVSEAVPKTLGVRAPSRWSLRVAAPVSILVRLLSPLHRLAQAGVNLLLNWVVPASATPVAGLSDDEYQELAKMAWQSGTLDETEKDMIVQILQLDRRTVKDVMLSRSQMACISDELPVARMIEEARRFRHRRLPVYDETPDTIVGILNTRVLLLDPEADLEEAIEFPSFVPESMNLLQLFRSLQCGRRGMAIVMDEYGVTAGLVTLEDILESMIGEIRGEGEEQGFLMQEIGPGEWRVNATLRLDDFRREYPALRDVPEVETLGGLVVHLCERVPKVGEEVRHEGLRFEVLAADERRVRELRVSVRRRKGAR